MDTDERFGRRLREIREARGASQQSVVASLLLYGLNWHQTTVAKVEAGTRPVRLTEALAVAAVFEMELDDFIEDPDSAETRARRAIDLNARFFELYHLSGHVNVRMEEIRSHLDAVREGRAVPEESSRGSGHLPIVFRDDPVLHKTSTQQGGATSDQGDDSDAGDAAGQHRETT